MTERLGRVVVCTLCWMLLVMAILLGAISSAASRDGGVAFEDNGGAHQAPATLAR